MEVFRSLLSMVRALMVAVLIASLPSTAAPPTASPAQVALHMVQQDVRIAEILKALGEQAPHGRIVLRNVRVVDAIAETIIPDQSVVTQNGVIEWVGEASKEPRASAAQVIEGAGRFLSPGLVDMHVHSSSASGWLLDLANGVTSVRDMGGFPWLIRLRDSVSARRILAPVIYLAGTIINAEALFGYAVVPRNALDARRIVRQQAACGYDFIKVHNIVPLPILEAIADEAQKLGMDLVGHVPHDISVRQAAQLGMRTMEHLKGLLNDATLKIGDTDYSAVVDGPEVWNTPTLYGLRGNLRGEEARAVLSSPEARYVPMRKRLAWSRFIDLPEDDLARTRQQQGDFMRQIITHLLQAKAKFLAGTDADGYPFQVMGFALVEEIQLLHQAGLSAAAAMRAATSEPARAMRVSNEFGAVRPGMRADLVVLEENPLERPSAFKSNRGVMAHGYWLDRKELDDALNRLADIYAEPDSAVVVNPQTVSKTYSAAKRQIEEGFAFPTSRLGFVSSALRKSGLRELASRFDALADIPKSGPCAEFTQ